MRDLETSVAWYCDHLGFEKGYGFKFPNGTAAFIALGDARLELFQVEGAAPMEEGRREFGTNVRIGGLNHLALMVDAVDDLVTELRAKGVEVVVPPTDVPNDTGDRYAFIHDNEGMLVELFQPGR